MINMTKEYRVELKALRKVKKQIERGLCHQTKLAAKEVKVIQTALGRRAKRCQKELARIQKREAILEGRLS